MRTERRCVQRKRPGGISYFQFEAGSGGIVLDASERGLAFQAADAIHHLGRSRICVSPRPEERIELNSDIVWIDRSRKAGGLRFVDQGAETAKKLRDWLRPSSGSQASEPFKEVPLPGWAVRGTREGYPEIRRLNEKPPSSPSMVVPPLRKEAAERRVAEQGPRPPLPPLFTSDLTWQEAEASSGRFVRNVATGFLIGVLLIAPVVLFEDFHLFGTLRPIIADSLIRLGEKLNGNKNLRPQGSASPLSPAQALEQSRSPSEPTANAARPETREHTHPTPNASGQNNVQIPHLATPRPKETAEHSPEHRNPHSVNDRSAQAAQLWAAVGSGDSSAEVGLARLYLKGEGVPRNCEQARILLRAAAKGRNREARRQLQKLRFSGCR